MELGYPIERTASGWEVGGIDRAMIEKFSGRAAPDRSLSPPAHGITDPKEKDRHRGPHPRTETR